MNFIDDILNLNSNEITVKTQEELDAIPLNPKGRIHVKFGTYTQPAVVKNQYDCRVVVDGSFHAVVVGNSYILARGNSHVEARGNSHVEAWDDSSVEAFENSSVAAYDNSFIVAWGNSNVTVRGSSSVLAYGNSHVEARGIGSVTASENSSIVAQGTISVTAYGNSQIVDKLTGGRIEISENARIVRMPKTITEYCDFYGLEHDKKTGKFYKCVHKVNGKYFSDRDESFEYVIGEKAMPDAFDEGIYNGCGHGIHVAYPVWALDFGRGWDDIAIIEVEAKLDDIVVPVGAPGKVRCKEVKVLREVPLEECGPYGKFLAKKLRGE